MKLDQPVDNDLKTATGAAASWPENWPTDLPQYPGSALSSSHIGSDEGSELMLGVSMITSDSSEQVHDFYSSKALAAGWKLRGTTEASGHRSDHYISPDGSQVFNVLCEPCEGGYAIALMVAEDFMDAEEGVAESGSVADSGEASIELGEDEALVVTTGKLPDGFPADVLKPYPGGQTVQAMIQGENKLLSMATQDSVDQVARFYIEHLTSRGWAKGDDVDMAGTRMIAFNSKAGEIAFSVTDGGSERVISLALMPDGAAGGGSADDSTHGDANAEPGASITAGKLPEGFPTNVLPLYPGGEIEAAAINGNEYTLLQLSTDRDDQLVKHYDKLFREAGWKKETSVTIEGSYIGGWSKDGNEISMTATKRESGKAFISLVYVIN